MYFIMTWLGFVVIPLVWLGINFFGVRCSISDIYSDWKEHKQSGDRWGYFDKGAKKC